ncbi:MAG: hypothetical protein HKM93_11820 [Desulfobacteraceae bacterium]|nr:hypothetical protein [Desulfobacteraceae bacterium]
MVVIDPRLSNRRIIITMLMLTCLLLISVPAGADGGGHGKTKPGRSPVPALVPLGPDGNMSTSPGDRCPVCAMVPSTSKKFVSAIQLEDGTTYYFCGTGCMIRSYLHPEIFLNTDKKTIKRAVTRDYFSGDFIDAETANWIAGSDVKGPMGPAIVPVQETENVAVFKKRHGGLHVFHLPDLDDALWEKMTGKKAGK